MLLPHPVQIPAICSRMCSSSAFSTSSSSGTSLKLISCIRAAKLDQPQWPPSLAWHLLRWKTEFLVMVAVHGGSNYRGITSILLPWLSRTAGLLYPVGDHRSME